MHIILVGLNHKTAPVEIREKCAFTKIQLLDMYRVLKRSDIVDAAVILVTCNRTEIYAAVRDVAAGFEILCSTLQDHAGMEKTKLGQYEYQHTDHNAISHLFSVASGLDSMILGEQQILGQLKDAYADALDADASDSIVNILFQTAFKVGKKVRTDTGINRYPVSVSSAAVDFCREIFDSLDNKNVLVLGAGETSELVVKYLRSYGVGSVIVSNRTYDHAVEMARLVQGSAIHFDRMPAELRKADIVISCTAAPHFVIREDNCASQLRLRKGSEIVMIDIAVPRDIAPGLGDVNGVFLYDIDDLQNVVEKNYKERLKAAHQARDIIEQQTTLFISKLATLPVVPVITSLAEHARSIKQEELEKALHKLGDEDERIRIIVSSLANAIANKIIHAPIANLKDKAIDSQGYMYADMIKELFDLELKESGYIDNEQNSTGNEGQ
ncbi:glutamyl-tRNA reductase [Thermodesulfobacteriota bacterium]